MAIEYSHCSISTAVLVFTKIPQVGRVKTRLIPVLGAEGASELYRRLLRRQIHWLARETNYPIQLWITPSKDHPLIRSLADDYHLTIRYQQGCDLGERMHHAAREALLHYRQAVLLGVDCPALTADYLHKACDWLATEDAVLGPAEDGGYVLLGLKEAAAALFQGHHWGGGDVAETTRASLRGLGWRWRELPMLWDLDRPEDLPKLEELGIKTGSMRTV
jgi:rSAM/selenodomain-associated transferase 1